MAEEAAALIDSLDDAQRKLALWPFPADDERRLLVLHADRSRWADAWRRWPSRSIGWCLRWWPADCRRPATSRRRRSWAGERARPARGFTASFERPRGRDPLMYFVRFFGVAVVDRHMELATRWPPRLVELHDHRRRAQRLDAVVLRRRSGQLAPARPASAASARRRRGPRPRARPFAVRRPARAWRSSRRARRPISSAPTARRSPMATGRSRCR